MQLTTTSKSIVHFLYIFPILVMCGAIPRVAIIGGGIGGASSAYFLRQLFGDKLALHLYEPGKIGGRMATLSVAGREYEAGGSILHPSNKYMLEFTEKLGLKKRADSPGRFGIYNGKEYVFKESQWIAVTLLRLLWRYGLDVFKLKSFVGGMMQHFSRIYTFQENGNAYNTVEKLLIAMSSDFINMSTQETVSATLKKEEFSELFVQELAEAVMRVNYGQNVDIGGFVGSVSLAGAEPGLWSIHGGNKQVPKRLIQVSGATLTEEAIQQISLLPNQKFEVSTDQNTTSTYDMLIVAVPLVKPISNISFKNFPTSLGTLKGRYHRTVATLVDGALNLSTVGLSVNDGIDEILTNNVNLSFNSIGRLYPVDYSEGEKTPDVWKVFSQKLLTNTEVNDLFTTVRDIKWVDWLAYPHYVVPCRLSPFVLHPGLFHTSSIEWAASAMEMSAIAGRNAALLAYGHWTSDRNASIDDKSESPLKVEL